MAAPPRPANAGVTSSALPFCDPRCPHASFPPEDALDGAGSCRTFAALRCGRLGKPVTRNAPCAVRFGERRPKAQW